MKDSFDVALRDSNRSNLLKKYFSVTLVLLIKIKKIRIIEDVKSKKAL